MWSDILFIVKLPKHRDLTPDQKRIYNSLFMAKQRCTNPNNKRYENYGGRGIKYHLEDNKHRIQIVLEQEPAWQKCKRKHPDEPVTINRIDNDGDYTESNIQWIPKSENSRQMHRDNPHKPANKASVKAKSKPVKCLTSGEVYPSAREAGRILKISNSNISECCNSIKNYAGKFDGKPRVWQYVN